MTPFDAPDTERLRMLRRRTQRDRRVNRLLVLGLASCAALLVLLCLWFWLWGLK